MRNHNEKIQEQMMIPQHAEQDFKINVGMIIKISAIKRHGKTNSCSK